MGILSQAVANLQTADQQVNAVSGLPPQAQQLQQNLTALIGPLVSQIQSLQGAIGGFVPFAQTQLTKAEQMLATNQPLPKIEAVTSPVFTKASNLQMVVNAATNQINAAASQMTTYFNDLAGIEAALTAQTSGLQGLLGDAQGEEAAAQKRYYYLLALGPFGLVGLSVALGLYFKWKSDVNRDESLISELQAQINSINGMIAASKTMGNSIANVVSKVSGVRNSVNFLGSDMSQINTDLGNQTSPALLAIMVRAAIDEVNTLGTDAS